MSTVTVFKNIKETSTPFYRDVNVIFERIREGKSKDLVKSIRTEKDKTTRNKMKQELPSICFSGRFNKRADNSLLEHSGLICLDFDGYPSKKEMIAEKDSLSKDKYVYSVFVSPSGDGLKVIVKIPKDIDNHINYFNSLEKHFNSQHFDKTSKNVSRVCYESYDPMIYINEGSKEWDKIEEQEYKEVDKFSSSQTIPITNENKIVDILMKWWTKRYGLVDGERNNNVYILAAAFNDYGVTKSLAEYVMAQFEAKDFPMSEIQTTINSAYSHTHKFGTKYYEDDDKVNQIKQKIKRGASRKDIITEFSDSGIHENIITNVIESIDEQESNKKFWSKSDKGAVSIIHYLFKEFLEDSGFFKFVPEGSRDFILVRVTNNLIENTSETEIKDFVLDYLQSIDDMSVYNYFADKTRFFKDDFLSMLASVDVYFIEDTSDSSYLYYRNCAVKVTKDDVIMIDYMDLGGYIWKDQIIDRDFDICDSTDCDYKTFVSNISGDDPQRIKSMESTIGYLMHGYKNLSYCPAVILNDEVITDNPEGGTGKGLFVNGVSKMKKFAMIDGKAFNFEKSFAYQTVSIDTQVLCFDDVRKHFDFERLFSIVTEGLTIEKKNKDAIKLPFSRSPKIVITTNYAIKGTGNSFERRKWELEFKQFYSKEFTPLIEFGRLLFSDWDTDEWCRFDNYMINNLKSYMNTGLVKSTFVNLKVRRLSAATRHEFIEWCGLIEGSQASDKLKNNTILFKSELYQDFVNDNPDFGPKSRNTISRTEFYKWLVAYGTFISDTPPLEGRDSNGRWIKFVTETPKKDAQEQLF
jgi:hypothetical protein